MSIVTALFLLGAAAGGLLFGWLGDKIGRVRAMTFSILCYSVFSGLSYFAQAPWHLGALRFLGALGMGGEWSLGVALVMECWPKDKRPLMAGLIGAAANLGYALIAVCGALPLYDERFAHALGVGGKLFAVVGTGQPQDALLVTRTAEQKWDSESLFETAIDPLEHALRPEPFQF